MKSPLALSVKESCDLFLARVGPELFPEKKNPWICLQVLYSPRQSNISKVYELPLQLTTQNMVSLSL